MLQRRDYADTSSSCAMAYHNVTRTSLKLQTKHRCTHLIQLGNGWLPCYDTFLLLAQLEFQLAADSECNLRTQATRKQIDMFPEIKSKNDGFEVMKSGRCLAKCFPVCLLELVKRQYDLHSLDVLSLWIRHELDEQLPGRIVVCVFYFCACFPMSSRPIGGIVRVLTYRHRPVRIEERARHHRILPIEVLP